MCLRYVNTTWHTPKIKRVERKRFSSLSRKREFKMTLIEIGSLLELEFFWKYFGNLEVLKRSGTTWIPSVARGDLIARIKMFRLYCSNKINIKANRCLEFNLK